MEYEIISTDTLVELEELVNDRIQSGWKPRGGVAVEASDMGIYYLQAMVREQNK